MAGFTSYDDLITELTTNGKLYDLAFFKYSLQSPEGVGFWYTHWTDSGMPGAGAAPAGTPGTVYSSTAGGITFANQASDQKHLMTAGFTASQSCTIMLYDRLVAVGGISVASTGDKTISSSALTRYTDGTGVQAWLEVTTATATTNAVVSMNSYTNEAGTSGRAGATVTFGTTAANINMMVGPLPLQSGDSGVRAISTINVATAASAGVVNVVLLRPIVYIPVLANQWNERDMIAQLSSMPRIYDGATLGIAVQCTTTAAHNLWGMVRVAYG